MPKCYQLIGVPASGKTTWVLNNSWKENTVHVSTDKWVDIFAREVNKTYNDVFPLMMDLAVHLMTKEVKVAQSMDKDIIWDQTNLTVKSRARKFRLLPEYEHIAVVFNTPEPKEHNRRLTSRTGKHIPESIIKSMIESYELPSFDEGFKDILVI